MQEAELTRLVIRDSFQIFVHDANPAILGLRQCLFARPLGKGFRERTRSGVEVTEISRCDIAQLHLATQEVVQTRSWRERKWAQCDVKRTVVVGSDPALRTSLVSRNTRCEIDRLRLLQQLPLLFEKAACLAPRVMPD